MEEIAELARTHSFSALSKAEKQSVLAEMPESEYQILHRALAALPLLDADIEPPADLRAELLARFAPARRSPLQLAFRPAVPVWQAAAAMLVGIGFTFFFMKKEPIKVSQKIVYQTIVQKDTIWRTRWRERVEKPVTAGVQNARNLENLAAPKTKREANPENLTAPTSVGTPISDTPELMGFFVSEKEAKRE